MTATGAVRGPIPILFVHYGGDAIRGSERVLLDLLTHLDRTRFRPVVWCNAEMMSAEVRALNIDTYLSSMPLLLGWSAEKFAFGEYRRLRHEAVSLIRRHAIGIVHVNSGAPTQWMAPVARAMGIPMLAHLHAHYVLRDRCTLLLYQAPILVGCSRAVIADFAKDGVPERRLRVIYNGVDFARLSLGDATQLRAHLHIPDDAIVVAAVGALVELKGFDILIRAVRLLKDRGISAIVLFVGEGPEEHRLRSLVTELELSDYCRFLGSRHDVGAIFRDVADVVAAPSRQEAFGLTVTEAAMFGVPAIVSDIPGLNETVRHGVTGLLVPRGNIAGFADAITDIIRDPDRRESMATQARNAAASSFTSTRMATEFMMLYSALATEGRPGRGGMFQGIAPWRRLGVQWIRNRFQRG